MRKTFTTSALLALASSLFALPLTPGNLLVTQIGEDNRSVALNNASTQLYLKEYTPSGTLVQTFTLDGSGTNRLTSAGISTSEGFLSYNEGVFAFAGYDADLGVTAIAATNLTSTARKVGMLDMNGNLTLQLVTDGYDGSNIRGAIVNGGRIWMTGSSGTGLFATAGVRTVPVGGSTSVQLSGAVTNTRVPGIWNGQLYFSTSSGLFKGVNIAGFGAPTSANTPVANIITDPTYATNNPPYDFAFDGENTVYLADERTIATGGGVQKWTFDGTTWNLAYTLNTSLPNGVRSLTLTKSGGDNVLYITSAAGVPGLFTVTDTGAGSAFTQITTSDSAAQTRTAFRGIRIIPAKSTKTISGTVDLGSSWVGTWADGPYTSLKLNVYAVGGTTPLQSAVVNLDGSTSTPSYSFPLDGALTGASYEIRAEGVTFLRQRKSLSVGGGGGTANFTLINGNCKSDDQIINTDDYLVLSGAFDTAEGTPEYVIGADLDKNGIVNTDDYLILSANFDTSGDE